MSTSFTNKGVSIIAREKVCGTGKNSYVLSLSGNPATYVVGARKNLANLLQRMLQEMLMETGMIDRPDKVWIGYRCHIPL